MEIRPTTDQDLGVFVDTLHTAFGRFPDTPAEGGGGVWWSAFEMDRSLLALAEDGRPVGTAGAYSFELTLPGGALVPVGGVTAVGVLPSHRRRGTLGAMMRHQLGELRARGEFLSVLLASEAPIYGRFGYGPATYTQRLTVPRRQAAPAVPRAGGTADAPAAGSVEVLRRAECGEILEEVYDRYRRAQPGALSRPHRWWELRAGQPPISPAPRYVAVHRDADGVPDGYASYTIGESDTLTVDETIAADDAVFSRWPGSCSNTTWSPGSCSSTSAPEHPLRWQFEDFRAGEVSNHTDWLWVRAARRPGRADRARLVRGRRARPRRDRPVPRGARPPSADRQGRQGRLRPDGPGARPLSWTCGTWARSTSAAPPRAPWSGPGTSGPTVRAPPPSPTPSSAASEVPHCLTGLTARSGVFMLRRRSSGARRGSSEKPVAPPPAVLADAHGALTEGGQHGGDGPAGRTHCPPGWPWRRRSGRRAGRDAGADDLGEHGGFRGRGRCRGVQGAGVGG
ncbi:N-acetyltransferase Eis [Streptomyces tanashiensis]